jgi:hypothetical protein
VQSIMKHLQRLVHEQYRCLVRTNVQITSEINDEFSFAGYATTFYKDLSRPMKLLHVCPFVPLSPNLSEVGRFF